MPTVIERYCVVNICLDLQLFRHWFFSKYAVVTLFVMNAGWWPLQGSRTNPSCPLAYIIWHITGLNSLLNMYLITLVRTVNREKFTIHPYETRLLLPTPPLPPFVGIKAQWGGVGWSLMCPPKASCPENSLYYRSQNALKLDTTL